MAWVVTLIVGLVIGLCAGCQEKPPVADAPPAGSAQAASPEHPATEFPAATGALQADLGARKRGGDWPRFLGPTGDGKSPETGIITRWPAAGPRIVWQTRLGTGYAAPVVSRGRLFEFARHGGQNRLTCRNSETGAELWRFEYPTDYEDFYGYNNGPRCCPVVDDDRVYLFGPEGMLHCVRIADGRPAWKLNTTEKFGVVQNFFGVGSTPIVEGDLLIVHVGGSPPNSGFRPDLRQQGNGSGIVAFNKFTGEEKYRLSDELASYSSPTLATIGGRRWCFLFARGGLLGFEPSSGRLDFQFPWRAKILESVNASNPVVVDNQVFISETYGPGSALLRVAPGKVTPVWTDAAPGKEDFDGDGRPDKSLQTHWNTAIHVDGYLYASSGRHKENAELRCIEWATGKIQWSEPDLTRSSLTYADGHFFCLTETGELLLLKVNPKKYEVAARATLTAMIDEAGPPRRLLKEPAWAAPVLAHGLLYVRGDDRLVCLEVIPE